MNEHVINAVFCLLFGSCLGLLPMSKVVGNGLLLIGTIISAIAAFASMFVDATSIANVWYYCPIYCIMAGLFSYLYLQGFGNK